MLFNSYEFILLFLPITVVLYFLTCKIKNRRWSLSFLVAASLIFCAFSGVLSLVVLLFSALLNYFVGNQISKRMNTSKKIWLTVGIILNIGILSCFKYANLWYAGVTELLKINIYLPIGLSFYTFQQISYLVDTYRSETVPCDFSEYLLYVSFFPKLTQGPIVRQEEFIPKLSGSNRRILNWDNISKGISVFAIGLSKKVLLADNFGKIVDFGFANISSLNSFESLLAVLGYTFQIYFDFSGYCDMAVGVALAFNISLPQNFNSPYRALSISEFWKRWHITLTNFLTKYVYIPLGGSRKGKIRTYFNVIAVFLISGIWHGTGLTFLVWGMMHGIAMVLNRIFKTEYRKIPKIIQWGLTFVFVNITWVFFRAESITDALNMLKQVFVGEWSFTVNAELTETLLQPTFISIANRISGLPIALVVFYVSALLAVLLLKNSNEKLNTFKPNFVTWAWTYLLLILSVLSVSGVSTFLYSNF